MINPGGGHGIYGKVHFKNRAVGIVPIDEEGNIYLVGQYRFPLDAFSWEIPEGGAPFDEDILNSAKRELKEETGIEALNWQKLLDIHLSNSVSDEIGHIYLATGLSYTNAEPEETEEIHVKKLPFDEAYQMLLNGEITDSLTIAGLLRTKILLLDKYLIFENSQQINLYHWTAACPGSHECRKNNWTGYSSRKILAEKSYSIFVKLHRHFRFPSM